MARKSPKRRKRRLTEQEQEQLIMAVEGLTYPERAAFLKSKEYSTAWYRNMRGRYLTRHPELNLDKTATPVAASPQTASSFKDATRAQKFRMLAEYDTLPRAERQAWREAHGVDSGLLVYYRKQFPSSSTALTLATPNGSSADTSSLLAEYDLLPKGEKTQWLKDHGMTHQRIYDLRYRLKYHKLKPPQKSTNHLPYPPVLPPTAPQPLTVDDMINAFKVERDMLNETIAKMERMKASHQ